MIPDEIETVTEKEEVVQLSDSEIAETVEEFMLNLIEAGFEVRSVLEHGFQYAYQDVFCSGLQAAKAIRQAAKNLHIDAECQRREARMASQELRERLRNM
jgi:hypothetical protein